MVGLQVVNQLRMLIFPCMWIRFTIGNSKAAAGVNSSILWLSMRNRACALDSVFLTGDYLPYCERVEHMWFWWLIDTGENLTNSGRPTYVRKWERTFAGCRKRLWPNCWLRPEQADKKTWNELEEGVIASCFEGNQEADFSEYVASLMVFQRPNTLWATGCLGAVDDMKFFNLENYCSNHTEWGERTAEWAECVAHSRSVDTSCKPFEKAFGPRTRINFSQKRMLDYQAFFKQNRPHWSISQPKTVSPAHTCCGIEVGGAVLSPEAWAFFIGSSSKRD